MLALNASKAVLCEKPITVNAPELKALIKLAKEKNVFLMEAMWTRFLPVTQAIKKVITDGKLGELKVLYVVGVLPGSLRTKIVLDYRHADLAGDFHLESEC